MAGKAYCIIEIIHRNTMSVKLQPVDGLAALGCESLVSCMFSSFMSSKELFIQSTARLISQARVTLFFTCNTRFMRDAPRLLE